MQYFNKYVSVKIQKMQSRSAGMDSILAFSFLDANILGHLKRKLLQYMGTFKDLSPPYSPLEFWKSHAPSFPARAIGLLVQPSSALERVLFLLNSSFGQQ